MGKDDDSGERGAQEANRLSQQGIEELRRQFGITEQNVQQATGRAVGGIEQQFGQTAGNINPFIQTGIGQLGSLAQGASIGGFGERLNQIFSGGALDPLIAERTRAAQGQLAAGGLTRSGQALQDISAIPQDIGFGIEQLLTGRSSQLAGQGLQAALGLGQLGGQASLGAGRLGVQSALGLGQLGAQSAGNIAGIFGQQGQNVFQGANQDAQRQSDFFGDVLGLAGTVGGAFLGGPGGAALGSSLFGGGGGGGGGGAGAGIGFGLRNQQGNFFSDRNLKENIEKIGNIGPLSLYQWDWIPETKDMLISKFPTMGFVADEVKKHFPDFVKDFYGFDSVNYSGLLDKLEGVA